MYRKVGVKASVGLQLACQCLLTKCKGGVEYEAVDADGRKTSEHFENTLSHKDRRAFAITMVTTTAIAASGQLSQTPFFLTEDQEGLISEDQRRVYIAYRAIFNGDKALVRKRKRISKIVSQHHQSGKSLVEGLEENDIVRILEVLLTKKIFKMDSAARLAFPDLFTTALAMTAQHSSSEADVAKSHAEMLEDIANLDSNQNGEEMDSHDPVHPILLESESTQQPFAFYVRVLTSTPATPPQSAMNGLRVPSLYPLYLPYKVQHQVLWRIQRLLEECCYAFTEEWLPDLLEQRRWDCPEAIELNNWTEVVIKRLSKLPCHCFGDLGSDPRASLTDVLMSINDLGHAAVHRVRTRAKGISEMIRCATKFARALRSSACEKQLDELHRELDFIVGALELNKKRLESNLGIEMQDIARQRKELDKQEKNALTTILIEDKDYCSFLGGLLSRSAERIFAGATGDGLNVTKAEKDLALETTRIKQPSLALSHKLPHQAGLACPPEARPYAVGDSPPKRCERRPDSAVLQDADLGSPTLSETPGELHCGIKASNWAVLKAIGENNAVGQDAGSASFVTDLRVRDLGNRVDQETFAALSEAINSKLITYDFHRKHTKLSDKRLRRIHEVVRKRTKLNISAYQVGTCS